MLRSIESGEASGVSGIVWTGVPVVLSSKRPTGWPCGAVFGAYDVDAVESPLVVWLVAFEQEVEGNGTKGVFGVTGVGGVEILLISMRVLRLRAGVC
jgi:hypothetical protein